MNVDGMYQTQLIMSSSYHELNINTGLFLGQISSHTSVFMGNYASFRGCLRSVRFNSNDVLASGYSQQAVDSRSLSSITWDCAQHLGVSSSRPIQFLSNTSFAAFPSIDMRRSGGFVFELRTLLDSALLLYNSAQYPNSDLIAIELINGHVRASVNKGSGTMQLQTQAIVNNGQWHQVHQYIFIITVYNDFKSAP